MACRRKTYNIRHKNTAFDKSGVFVLFGYIFKSKILIVQGVQKIYYNFSSRISVLFSRLFFVIFDTQLTATGAINIPKNPNAAKPIYIDASEIKG
jgi:hypothetical protein